jgi:2-dehydro-3-deoxyphosphooctonate aldolase (KDO 8-P synthase)
VPVLARAAAAAGVDGFFFEVHPAPARAMSDAANSLKLEAFESLARKLVLIDKIAKGR